ncbi:YlxR family protein [Herbiconiux sp. KACC 21604]|uniref:YlxR family protein n=1 Tax=unclassified Herbiconiux TaxID=2618217 RepID=UPI001492DC55|nr:YlxR family protein [Herbiconiux sp. SALV-R1]QJU53763.1 YlxR family protein [Herbiconiux sp. SALV-R1]WPO84768.1 YlxR family protein [Herbiconiux sp. KACC 21604]
MEPVRTCVGCRARANRSSLLRVVARADGPTGLELVVDETATLPGRGAWLHPSPECFRAAVTRRAFGRALRVEGTLDTSTVENRLNGTVNP